MSQYVILYIIKTDSGIALLRFDMLKNGLSYLKHEESRRATGPLAFVKENLGTFLNALDKLNCILLNQPCRVFITASEASILTKQTCHGSIVWELYEL